VTDIEIAEGIILVLTDPEVQEVRLTRDQALQVAKRMSGQSMPSLTSALKPGY
jgi:hypothetical protein